MDKLRKLFLSVSTLESELGKLADKEIQLVKKYLDMNAKKTDADNKILEAIRRPRMYMLATRWELAKLRYFRKQVKKISRQLTKVHKQKLKKIMDIVSRDLVWMTKIVSRPGIMLGTISAKILVHSFEPRTVSNNALQAPPDAEEEMEVNQQLHQEAMSDPEISVQNINDISISNILNLSHLGGGDSKSLVYIECLDHSFVSVDLNDSLTTSNTTNTSSLKISTEEFKSKSKKHESISPLQGVSSSQQQ